MEVFDGNGGLSSKQMYKFIDRDSSMLVLRADMTPAIARIAATAYEKSDVPLRFYYFENVFRYNEHYQGKLREFTQAGIELIGVNSFKICIGQAQFFYGVLEEGGFDKETCEKIRKYTVKKDYSAVQKIAEESDAPDNIKILFKELPLLIGDKKIVERARELINSDKARGALDDLENVYQILSEYKIENFI